MAGKVIELKCGRCEADFGWANFDNNYGGVFSTIAWRCNICYELERLDTKHQREENKKTAILPVPQNFERLKKIKDKKIEQIDNAIKELEEQKEEIKKQRF